MRLPGVKAPRDYAEQTYNSPYRLIRYPHQKRYRLAVSAILAAHPSSLLDYGTGDGYVLAELASRSSRRPCRVVAYEPIADAAGLARERLGRVPAPERFSVIEALPELGNATFEMIICLGVLEHMPLLERERFYGVCAEHLAPGGLCLIDVPVEVGFSVGVKEAARVALKGRSLKYSPSELVRVVAGKTAFDPGRFAADNQSTWIQDHTGFDHRLLARELEARFQMIASHASPFTRLPPWLFNQDIFFLVSPR